jgi:hypothetical protein
MESEKYNVFKFQNEKQKKTDHKHQYSCVQYNLPTQVAQQVISWGNTHVPDEILYSPPEDSTYGRESLIHCTVFFGLHTDSAVPVVPLLENESPFSIRLGQISCFSNDFFDVLKIDVSSDNLIRLHNKLGGCLSSTRKFKNYIPHITIAYLKKGEGNKFIGSKTFDKRMIFVDVLSFSSKNGSRCRVRLKRHDCDIAA